MLRAVVKRRWGALRKHRQHATSLLGVIDQRVDSYERPMAGGMVKGTIYDGTSENESSTWMREERFARG